jgi:hypothetical protein
MVIDGHDVRKLVRTVWFRTVLPELSAPWQEHLLTALVAAGPIADHPLKVDRRDVRLSEMPCEQLKELVAKTSLPEPARTDVDLLLAVARLWGDSALQRFNFAAASPDGGRSRLAHALLALRK